MIWAISWCDLKQGLTQFGQFGFERLELFETLFVGGGSVIALGPQGIDVLADLLQLRLDEVVYCGE